ncbi:MAG TPA: glycosyltransferase family 4 protein [Acidimicrobiales bacterium]|nr:glycosyltransferase family 4 protein [Acidimicrobiales bacterium]
MVAIHQFIPSLASRDAIGSHTFQVQDLLRQMGFESEIFAGDVEPGLAKRCLPYREFPKHRRAGECWLLYQASIGSPMVDFLMERPEPKLMNFHNITPAELVEGWEPGLVDEVNLGRLQLVRLAPVVVQAIAVSAYNRRELEEVGYARTAVAPLLVDLDAFDRAVDRATLARLLAEKEAGGPDLLFVGRITPHKAQHDLVKALAAYRRLYHPGARLRLVGGEGSRSYRRALGQFVGELGLEEAVDFAGSVTAGQLAAYYRAADAFVCASDHEGFCVPLLEAMHHRLPVVAYGAAAVPDTVGGAGLVLADKSPLSVASAVHRVVSDPALRARLGTEADRRLADHSLTRTRQRFAEVIGTALQAA